MYETVQSELFMSKDFKSYCEDLIDQFNKKELLLKDVIDSVCKEFDITDILFHRRFKSVFGKTIREHCKFECLPDKHQLSCMILSSSDVKELWNKVHVPNGMKNNLFAKYYGVSTFKMAKAYLISYRPYVEYNPTIADNESIAISQFFGDGSWNILRGAFIISHGEKQFEYLVMKAGLFNKAWPTTKPAGNTRLLTHTQGHKYGSWYSGRLPSKICDILSTDKPETLVCRLTTLGAFLWFMDDGYCNFNFKNSNNNTYFQIYVHNVDVAKELVIYLKQFGISTNVSGQYICVKDVINAINFYKIFIEPFKHLIPECMAYKVELKI